jgi:hypothetical protein
VSVEGDAGGADPRERYEFAAPVPFGPVPRGTTILVRGPPQAAPGKLAMRLLAPPRDGDGRALLVETDDTARGAAARWRDLTAASLSRLAVVGCNGGRDAAPEGLGASATVGAPGDLTGIGVQYGRLARSFARGEAGRLRVGLDTVSTLLLYCDDLPTVYRFLHTLTGRTRASGRLGVHVVNPALHDERTGRLVAGLFDVTVDVRRGDDGTREARPAGLPGRTAGWTTL